MTVGVSAEWRGAASFGVATASGHRLTTDGAPEHGGVNCGPRPMELLLASAASCSAFDVVTILKKGRHPVKHVAVAVSGERALAVPAVFTSIHLSFVVRGAPPKAARRAVELSVTKYCSALAMLAEAAAVTWQADVPADGGTAA